MAKSIKLGADTYLDASGVEVNSTSTSLRTTLQEWTGSTQGLRLNTVASNASLTYTLANFARVIFITNSAITGTKNIYLVSVTSTGAVSYTAVLAEPTGFTVTTGTNTITFTNTYGASVQITAFATSYYITNIS